MTTDAAPEPRQDRASFAWWLEMPTRWMDNDVYGHVNNVQYYSFFDTAVNLHLIRHGGLDIQSSPVIGYVVETRCQYRKSLVFPDVVEAGIRVARIGRSSVTYEVGLFRQGDADLAAFGHFVHVYVDRQTNRPAPIPAVARAAMETLIVG